MTTLTIRPSVGMVSCYSLAATDCAANSAKLFAEIVDLLRVNDATAQLDDDTLACELQRCFDAPDVDRARDLRVWQDAQGKLIGFGQLLICEHKDEIECSLYFDIHPAWRGDTLATEILQWSEARLREVGREQRLRVKVHTYCREDRFDRLVQLKQQDFMHERSFFTMACSLNQSVFSPSLPNGFTLQPLSHLPLDDDTINAWVELFNESFIDHWNHHDLTVEAARYWLFNNPHHKPELNLVVVAPDGTFAGFCVGYINQPENVRSGCHEGWIKFLGTRRGFRKLGLGRAMLLAQMRQLKTAGVEQVKLGVDAQSATSAVRLYHSVDFQPIKTWLSYVKEIQP